MIGHKSAASLAVLAVFSLSALNAAAQGYPVKTVRYIVPMGPGMTVE